MGSRCLSAIIAELSLSGGDEDRQKTRISLEERFLTVGATLDQLINTNHEDLPKVLKLSSKTINTISSSKRKCQDLKERLKSCMNFLQCQRDSLRTLWVESLQHEYVHSMLEEIERLRKIPSEVRNYLLDKKFADAADILVSALKLLEGKFSDADALKELKLELSQLQEKLYFVLLEELRKELYISDSFFEKFDENNLKDVTYDELFSCPSFGAHAFKDSLNQINFDNSHVTVLLDCMSVMDKLPEMTEFLEFNSQQELLSVTKKASKLMLDVLQKSVDQPVLELPIQQQQRFLLDLLETVLDIYRQIILHHKSFLNILQYIAEVKGVSDLNYKMDDIYSKIQATIEHFIEQYIEIQPLTLSSRQDVSIFTNSQNANDISAFFLCKGRAETVRPSLFKFRYSIHGINKKRYTQQEKKILTDESFCEGDPGKPSLVCKPAVRNIILIFKPLKAFVLEIESSLLAERGVHCPLYSFLFDCTNIFLDQVNSEINRMLESVFVYLEAWNVSNTSESLSPLSKTGSEYQILTSFLVLNNNLKELQNLINYLPDYSKHFLNLMYYILLDYKEFVLKAFRSLVEEEQNILSFSWAVDRDIKRLLKSFSNWKYLQNPESSDAIESPEDVRLRNKDESELLIRNLQSEEQSAWDIIRDPSKLSNLALLHESLQWFSAELFHFMETFTSTDPQLPTNEMLFEQSELDVSSASEAENAISGLNKLAKDYDEFADICLLALQLEVRAHCFHYLLPLSGDELRPEELDSSVKRLMDDFLQMDEVLIPILPAKKMKYIFEGLGELVSSIFIYNIASMVKISEKLIIKMDRSLFAVQRCLSNITMAREVSLEKARQYLALLKLNFDEILSDIVEEGPAFQEHEYASIFRLLSSNQNDDDLKTLSYYLDKLKQLFRRINAFGK